MRVVRAAEKAVDALAIALFVAMFGLVIVQVALRYVFNRPLVFSDELASYLFVWVSFLGWTMASRRRIHIGIGVVVDRLPPGVKRVLHAAWCVVSVLFALVLLVVGVALAHRNADVQMVSVDFTLWPLYIVVPFSAVLLAAYGIRDLLFIVRRGDLRTTEAKL